MERSTIFNGKIHYKWPFSIAMLVHQRVPHRIQWHIGRFPRYLRLFMIKTSCNDQKPHETDPFATSIFVKRHHKIVRELLPFATYFHEKNISSKIVGCLLQLPFYNICLQHFSPPKMVGQSIGNLTKELNPQSFDKNTCYFWMIKSIDFLAIKMIKSIVFVD